MYSSAPYPLAEPVYWPMFVVAVMAAIIASQSLILASFSIVQQSMALGCFPRVKVVHTSSKYEGQVLACVGVTLESWLQEHIANWQCLRYVVVFHMINS